MTEVLITSSVLIAVIALLRAALRDRIRPGLQYALWGLVLLRLLVPVSWFESPVSVAEAAEPIVRQVQHYSVENTRTVTFPVTMGEIPESGEPNAAAARTHIAPLDIAKWVWLGGAAVLAAWFLFVNIRLARKLTRERKLYSKTHKIPVYVTKTLPSPCLYLGEIYLTEEAAADPERAAYIIAHELTHRRHLDGVWAARRVVCLAVYWFNPLVWLAAVLSRRDCELFCDAATVKRLGEEHRFDYGRTLLDLTAVNVRPGDLICSATTMSGSGKSLRERIVRISRNRKTSVLLAIVVILIAAIAVGFTFSGGETEDAAVSNPYSPGIEWGTTISGNEMFDFYAEYLEASGRSWDEASKYLWNLGDYDYQLGMDNFHPVTYASMLNSQQLSNDLTAFLMEIDLSDSIGLRQAVNFVARIDGELWVIRNQASIPEELQEGLDALTLAAEIQGESLGPSNGEYWDKVIEVFGPFLTPVDVEVFVGEVYEPVEPLAATTLEDLVYSTDGWEFNSVDQPAQLASPYRAYIKVTAADGRTLVIRDGVDGLFIYEGDYIVMEITLGDMTGDEFLAMLLNWAQAWPEEPGVTAGPDETDDLEEFFAPFLDPVAVEVTLSDGYVFPYTPTDTTLEEFIYDTAHDPFTIRYFDQPVPASHEADAAIRITAADGRQLIVWNDAGIFLSENGYLTAEVYGGVSGDSYIVWLYNWAVSQQEEQSYTSDDTAEYTAEKSLEKSLVGEYKISALSKDFILSAEWGYGTNEAKDWFTDEVIALKTDWRRTFTDGDSTLMLVANLCQDTEDPAVLRHREVYDAVLAQWSYIAGDTEYDSGHDIYETTVNDYPAFVSTQEVGTYDSDGTRIDTNTEISIVWTDDREGRNFAIVTYDDYFSIAELTALAESVVRVN